VVAGVLGGIAMFIWSSIAHMALPLGENGIKELPNESSVLNALATNVGEADGLYLFPGFGVGPEATRQQKHEAMHHLGERYAQNPSGFLVYHPPGRQMQMGKWLGVEFATELLEAIITVTLLAVAGVASFAGRVGFFVGIGFLAAIATNVSYWNWYGFPGVYTITFMVMQLVGFVCAGVVAALVLGKSTPARPA
jgi:hypothetical protein